MEGQGVDGRLEAARSREASSVPGPWAAAPDVEEVDADDVDVRQHDLFLSLGRWHSGCWFLASVVRPFAVGSSMEVTDPVPTQSGIGVRRLLGVTRCAIVVGPRSAERAAAPDVFLAHGRVARSPSDEPPGPTLMPEKRRGLRPRQSSLS